MSIPTIAPAVATGTTAGALPLQQRVRLASAIAELERSLNRMELCLLPSSAAPANERRRRCLRAALVYALDENLAH